MKTRTSALLMTVFLISSMIGMLNPNIQALELNHGDTEYELFTVLAEDQPMVDQLVAIRTTYNHSGFVMVYDSEDNLLGHGKFAVPETSSHHHLQLDEEGHEGMDMGIPAEGMTMDVLVSLPLDVVGEEVTAELWMDHDMDGMVNDTIDHPVMKDGATVSFTVTEALSTGYELSPQTVTKENPIIVYDKVIAPGPAWAVLHGNDNGSLGAMYGKTRINHGVNLNVELNLSAAIDNLGLEEGESLEFFAHMHHDYYEIGYFNKTTDTHVYSPAFDDPILGDDAAQLFELTLGASEDDASISTISIGLAFFTTLIVFRKKLR